jgi:hypothetical protein
VALRPPQVHPQQHLGEVGRVHPTGTRPDGHESLTRVVLTGEEGAHLHLLDRLVQAGHLRADLGDNTGIVFGFGQLQQHVGVVELAAQPRQLPDLPVDVRQLRGDLLRPRLVIPQVGGGRLLLKLCLLPAQPVEVEHGLDVAQGGVESLELIGEVGSSHNNQG